MRLAIVLLGFVIALGHTHLVRAQRVIPDRELQALRRATVLVEVFLPVRGVGGQKVEQARRGSGFVARTEGNRLAIFTAAPVLGAHHFEVFVVFEAGTPAERRFEARVASVRPETGIAVLEVTGMPAPPGAFAVADLARLVEPSPVSRPVFVGGYPLIKPKYPPVRLVRGTAATAGPDPLASRLPIQVDGLPDSGFIGGVVANEAGQPLGIATAPKSGSAIDQYVPLAAIVRGSEPELTGASFEVKLATEPRTSRPGAAVPASTVSFRAYLDDPLGTVETVGLLVVARSALPNGPAPRPDKTWEPIVPGIEPTPLAIANHGVTGQFRVVETSDPAMTFWVQPVFGDQARGRRASQPVAYRFGRGVVDTSGQDSN